MRGGGDWDAQRMINSERTVAAVGSQNITHTQTPNQQTARIKVAQKRYTC